MSDKNAWIEKELLLGLNITMAITGVGQFVIQYYDPNLNPMQKGFAVFFGCAIAVVFGCVAILIWKRK